MYFMSDLGLDIEGGARLIASDSYGDWYRDPWNWPEITAEAAVFLTPEDLDVRRDDRQYNYHGTPAFHVFDVPKSYLGIRPAVVQDSRSRLAFAAAAAATAARLHNSMPPWVYGWRYRDGSHSPNEWGAYKESQSTIGNHTHAAQTDITSFFASVNIHNLNRLLELELGRNPATSVITSILRAHDELTSRSGLPQRSTPSSLIAQLALRPVDDAIGAALEQGRIASARRWMDDISFEGSETSLVGLMREIQQSSRQAGLELNLAKTFITSGTASAAKLTEESQDLIQVSETRAADLRDEYEESYSTYIDSSALAMAEQKVLGSPSSSTRVYAGLVLRSLRHYGMFDNADAWAEAARYLPHSADHLSRYLSDASGDFLSDFDAERWFVNEYQSRWPHPDWVIAQFALAVPSAGIGTSYDGILRSWLTSGSNLQKVAVAVQRLSASGSVIARSAISGRLDKEHDPLLTRLLALGYLRAGGLQGTTKGALNRHPSNALISAYMERTGWTLPKVAADFDPSTQNNGAF
jgi:hypothetical protein